MEETWTLTDSAKWQRSGGNERADTQPEFQAPAYVAPLEQEKLALPEVERTSAEVLEWPSALSEQVVAVA